jgi:hypothetical protein
MENKPLIIAAIIIAIIGGFVVYFFANPPSAPTKIPEEAEEIVPAVGHVAERSGRMMEVLHDERIMFYVSGYAITPTIDAPVREEDAPNQFLTVDIGAMNMGGHIINLDPTLFRLKTSLGELTPSPYTSSIDAGLRSLPS